MEAPRWWEFLLIGLAAFAPLAAWLAPLQLRSSDPVLAVVLSIHEQGTSIFVVNPGLDPWGNPWAFTDPSERHRDWYHAYSLGPNEEDDGGTGDDILLKSIDTFTLLDPRASRLMGLSKRSLTFALVLVWIVLAARALRGKRRSRLVEVGRVLLAASGPSAGCLWIVAWDAGGMRTVATAMRPLEGIMLAPAEIAMAGTLAVACLLAFGMIRLRLMSEAASAEN